MRFLHRTAGILLTAVFVLSTLITGTLGWQSLSQQAKNEAQSEISAYTDVELLKLEKLPDGTETENPVPGAAFYLFTADDQQLGGRYVTDSEGKISARLEPGSYYFEELSPASGFSFDTDGAGQRITRYPFTVTDHETAPVSVSAFNIPRQGTLSLHKLLLNADASPLTEAQLLQEFSFTVTFSDGGTYLYRIDGGEPQHLTSGGTLTLLHGQTALFAALPVGVIYNITEQSAPGYATSGTGHRGTITEVGCEAVFTNTSMPQQIETGRLSISKEVTDLSGGQSDALEKAFSFTIFFSDGGAYWYTIDGGEPQLLASGSALSLQHGQTAMFENLPVGVQYTVTEADYTADGYTALVRDYAGQITGSDSLSLPFVNVYEPAAESGTLSVVKDVTGEMADPDKVFAFEVTFTGAGAPASPQRFTLKAGEQKVFDNIPHGVTYTVRETDSDGALPGVEVVSGFIAGGHNASVRFQNQAPDEPEPPASIRVTKRLAGEYPEADKDKAFCLTLLVDGKETPFTLKPGETMEFEVPAGACYEVREDDSEGYSQSIADGTGTALSGQTVNVAVTNTFENDRVLAEIEGEKTWDLGGYGETVLPPSITVRLVGNDRLVEERLVTPDSNGQWHYRFTAPKYDADGAEIVYTLEEAPLDTFIPAYHGYNIKNTYRPPLSLDPPLIQKVVMGENPPETQFSFLLKGEDGAPMPEGSDGSVKIVTLKGEGNAELGRFTYEKAGVYTYTISELDGGEEGWIYDASLYTLTVTVTEQDGKLTASRRLVKNGQAVDGLVFSNRYEPDIEEDTVIVKGTKTWEHGENPEERRPASITVEVYGDGELAAQRQVTAEDGWAYAFELPRYGADGHEIAYTVDEAAVPGYDKTVTGYDLVNTYRAEAPIEPDEPSGPESSGDPDTSGNSSEPAGPKTGDESHMAWYLLLLLSFSALLITALGIKRKVYRIKRRNHR